MEALIVLIIAMALWGTGVISECACLCIIIAAAILTFAFSVLYFKTGFLKIYYHNVLGWHTPDDSPKHSDGCSIHATCKYCGKEIMQDSQGNWF